MRTRLRSCFVVGAVALALLAGGPLTHASAQSPEDHAVVDKAIAWLLTQQRPDGGFEVA